MPKGLASQLRRSQRISLLWQPQNLGSYAGCVQNAQRRASIGISLRHSLHFLVVGSAGTGALRIRATRALMGVTMKK